MKVIILAGGYGTRLQEETVLKPKPMVEIGGQPMLWHIMRVYAAFNYKEFIIALGYKGEIIKSYFLNSHYLRNDFTIQLASGKIDVYEPHKEDWTVHLVDTGLKTQTGGRVKRLAPWVGDETFMLTYGDSIGPIDIARLVAYHRSHGKLATITMVRPPARFGDLSVEGDRVTRFIEKPQSHEAWINGGFFVLEPGVFDYIEGDETAWERAPLERLAADGQLMAFRHEDFWQSMDTLRDVRLLASLWEHDQAPWKIWD